jgi:hypothetical protein
MSELHEPLPEYFVTDDRQRLSAPTYEALAQCQIIMLGETGVAGPTLVEPGEIFSSEATPNHQWLPLNRAAGERFERWLAQLPNSGAGLSQAEITEAAYAMRPREGEPEIAHESWWPAVLKYAAALKDKRMGNAPRIPQPAQPHRSGGAKTPVMPFASHGTAMPAQVGQPGPQDAPQRVVGADVSRRARPQAGGAKSPLANSAPADSVAQTAGS